MVSRLEVMASLRSRKASDEVKHEDYTKKFEVSDNLKWSLSGDSAAENQQPLGRTASASPPATTAAGASGQR